MSEKHIGKVVQVIGPVLDIRFGHDELPALDVYKRQPSLAVRKKKWRK